MDFVYLSRARNLASHSVTRAHIHTHAQWTQALNTVTLECWQSVVFFACNIVSCLASQLLFYTSHMWESVGRSVARFLFYTFALTYNTQQKSKSNMLCLCNFLILSRFIRARVCVCAIFMVCSFDIARMCECVSLWVCVWLHFNCSHFKCECSCGTFLSLSICICHLHWHLLAGGQMNGTWASACHAIYLLYHASYLTAFSVY